MEITLSSDQKNALDQMMEWWGNPEAKLLTLGGFAGTGKSTLLAEFRTLLPSSYSVAFCTFTGKASTVIYKKLKGADSLFSSDTCGTIHSLIYEPVLDDDDIIVDWILKTSLTAQLIIIDEASMVNEELFKDIRSFGLKVLAVGDHGQLPPIGGSLNLMDNPHIKLEKIHRQAEENPIIQLSLMARLDGYIPYGTFGNSAAKVPPKDPMINTFINNTKNFNETAILCGFNKTRVDLNKRIRIKFKFPRNDPIIGDRVICLQNNKDANIYNGLTGTLIDIKKMSSYYRAEIKMDGYNKHYIGPIMSDAFNAVKPDLNDRDRIHFYPGDGSGPSYQYPDVFDYGYCLSVHKSQGSEWNRILLIEQRCSYWEGENWNRWLYTAVTRASEQLLIVG